MGITEHLAIAAAVRPHPNETVSGDGWSVRWHEHTCRIALVDGVGHGATAEVAAQIALDVFNSNPGSSPEAVLRLCHRDLRHTRGAVMAVAVIDVSENTLEVAGVGNIEVRLLMNGREQHALSQRGILGSNMPTVRPLTIALDREWILVLHSDGVRSCWGLADLLTAAGSGQALTRHILAEHSRPDDDACVVIACPRNHVVT